MTYNDSLSLPLRAETFGLDATEEPIELLQTHIGLIYVSRSFAFKLKKHVKFDFLDFSTMEKRRWALERELTLNARLCPDLYLGLHTIVRAAGGDKLAPADKPADGAVVDWAIRMRRMPTERMLDRLLRENVVTREDVETIADVLAEFYRRQRGAQKIPPGGLGDLESVRANVEENLQEGATLDPAIVAPEALRLIGSRARRYLANHGDVIQQRARDGFIVDGHGDLRAENICLPLGKPPLLFDCIEFNDRFRIIDCCLDAAFLAMDLDSREREDLSAAFLQRYRDGCDPHAPPELLTFYLGYRAFIKAKVAAWIAADANVPAEQRAASRDQARSLIDLAVRYALRGKPALIVCCGISGSGKSTLAREVAARLKCEHAATDLIRDEFTARGAPAAERYAPGVSHRVYQRLYERAERALSDKRAIVLDGTFTRREVRRRAGDVARAVQAPAILLWADCSEDARRAHMQQREQNADTFGSEATFEVAREQAAGFETPSAAEFDALCRIDTNVPLEDAKHRAWLSLLDALSGR